MYNYQKISQEFVVLAQKTQNELRKYCYNKLAQFYKKSKIYNDKQFVYAKGNIPLMLVAHLDTVHKNIPSNIWYNADFTKVKADEGIGGDDRCGVYAILTILNRLDKRRLPSVLFTTDEEIGGIGVAAFCKKFEKKKLNVNAFIEIDRAHKNDVVNYSDDNFDLVSKFEEMGYKYEFGSYTDIVDLMETFGISGVNLSSGYYHAHTTNEYVNFKDLMWTIDNITTFINNPTNYEKPYEYEEYKYSRYGSKYGRYSDWHGDYLDDYKYPSYNGNIFNQGGYKEYDDYDYCVICGRKCNIDDEMVYSEDGYLCNDCAKRYAEFYRICPECGSLLYDDDHLTWCSVCGYELDKYTIHDEENEEIEGDDKN